jgi:hypothetical protein
MVQEKVGITPSDTDHQFPAIFRDKAAAWSMFHFVQSFNSGQETTQVAVHEWYHNTPRMVLRRLMEAARDRIAIYNLRGICWVSICLVNSLTVIKLLQMSWVQIPLIYKWSYYIGISWKYGTLSNQASRKNSILYTSWSFLCMCRELGHSPFKLHLCLFSFPVPFGFRDT